MLKIIFQKALSLGNRFKDEKIALSLAGAKVKINFNIIDTFRLKDVCNFSDASGSEKRGLSETLLEREEAKAEKKELRDNGSEAQNSFYASYKDEGSPSFEELALTSDIFVDKSLFIKDVLDGGRAVLITRPRRWGKTICMTMLKTFLQVEAAKDGEFEMPSIKYKPKKRVFFEGAKEYQLPDGTTKCLPRLKICDEKFKNQLSYVEKYQGCAPVIFISFRNPELKKGPQALIDCIRVPIQLAYEDHMYLVGALKKKIENESDFGTKFSLERDFKTFCRMLGEDGGPSNKDIAQSIFFLSRLLYEHFGKGVYLLIDEYDAPLNSFTNEEDEKYQAILEEMRTIFIAGIKENKKYLQKTVLTGILRLAKERLLSCFNNLHEFGVLDKRFADHFGFNQDEVNYLVEDTLKASPHLDKNYVLNQIKKWYNGYNISGRILYNPWSILYCLSIIKDSDILDNAFREYWVESGSNELAENIYTNLEDKCEIDKLIDRESAELEVSRHINYRDKSKRKLTLNSLLLHTGYITIHSSDTNESNSERLCVIPNLEVKKYLTQNLLPIWAEKKLKIKVDWELIRKLYEVDIEDIKIYTKIIEDVLLKKVSKKETEPGFCALLAAQYKIKLFKNIKHDVEIEHRTDDGKRADAIFIPYEGRSETGVVHEYKVQNDIKNLSENVESAFWQIYANKYMEKLLKHSHVQRVIIRPVVFYREDSGWKVELKEHTFSIEAAKKLNSEVFSKDGNILKISNDLIHNQGSARNEFLLGEEASNLNELISRYLEIKLN